MKKKKGGKVHTGATDGCFNLWVPDSGNFTKPIKIKDPGVTFVLSLGTEGWVWVCTRCKERIVTTEYKRPEHTCLDKTQPE